VSHLENYPIAPFLDALRTVTGRVVLVLGTVVLGSCLGGITATRELGGAWDAIGSFFLWAASSFLFSVGVIAFPAAFLFALLFVRREWPLWTVTVVALLIWWNAHKTIYYLLNQSAGAKTQKQIEAMVDKAASTSKE